MCIYNQNYPALFYKNNINPQGHTKLYYELIEVKSLHLTRDIMVITIHTKKKEKHDKRNRVSDIQDRLFLNGFTLTDMI